MYPTRADDSVRRAECYKRQWNALDSDEQLTRLIHRSASRAA